MAENTNYYPRLVVENNKKPNRWYAFPFIGLLVKIVFLIPVFLEIIALGLFSIIILLITWFVVLFTGNYWDFAYRYFLGVMRLSGKIQLFVWGITDQYPGFTFSTKGIYTLEIVKPTKPNRWFAVPFIGILVRFILLIPYLIFEEVLSRGTGIALIISWFAVLFKKRFPESLYEFERDTLRVSFAASVYILGLSDTYPSFTISMKHQTTKILLLIAGAILFAWDAPFSAIGNEQPYGQNDNFRNTRQYQQLYDQYPHENLMMPSSPSKKDIY